MGALIICVIFTLIGEGRDSADKREKEENGENYRYGTHIVNKSFSVGGPGYRVRGFRSPAFLLHSALEDRKHISHPINHATKNNFLL